jgi:hypothetical protein
MHTYAARRTVVQEVTGSDVGYSVFLVSRWEDTVGRNVEYGKDCSVIGNGRGDASMPCRAFSQPRDDAEVRKKYSLPHVAFVTCTN